MPPKVSVNQAAKFAESLAPGLRKSHVEMTWSGLRPASRDGRPFLGVLPGFPGPHKSAIIARLTGKNAEKTGVFAGMSGSPVYIDGRLVGVAHSPGFASRLDCSRRKNR